MIILEISSSSIKHDLSEILFMRDNLYINYSVYKFTYICKGECMEEKLVKSIIERGYKMYIYDISYDNRCDSNKEIGIIFNVLKKKFMLKCCYIDTMNYKGCIYNILNSQCPGCYFDKLKKVKNIYSVL